MTDNTVPNETNMDVQAIIEQGAGTPACENCGLTQLEKNLCVNKGIVCEEPMIDRTQFVRGERA